MKETFETIFYGSEEERFYHEAGADMGYMEDTGNHDVRTEGMSYGMMVCVQMNRKKNLTVYGNGYGRICISRMVREKLFAWSCAVDGTRNADGPAPDGEEYFAMALFLLQRDGEMEKAFSITAARQEQFYGNVSIRESQGIQESRCGIRKII